MHTCAVLKEMAFGFIQIRAFTNVGRRYGADQLLTSTLGGLKFLFGPFRLPVSLVGWLLVEQHGSSHLYSSISAVAV